MEGTDMQLEVITSLNKKYVCKSKEEVAVPGRSLLSLVICLFTGSSSSNDHPRREENPFSFKHFLNRDVSGGARPKVFPSKSPSTPRLIANPELTSGLPDFVQDHLVIEQCYLNQPSQPLSVDMNNLAEFGLE
ncbi:retrograde transport, endosome to plasma membrane [Homalodisca vitripennis]|nr:retrograde transport, endosome to plasma membrane [Homalodisca vitripennis]